MYERKRSWYHLLESTLGKSPVSLQCIENLSDRYRISTDLIWTLRLVESWLLEIFVLSRFQSFIFRLYELCSSSYPYKARKSEYCCKNVTRSQFRSWRRTFNPIFVLVCKFCFARVPVGTPAEISFNITASTKNSL